MVSHLSSKTILLAYIHLMILAFCMGASHSGKQIEFRDDNDDDSDDGDDGDWADWKDEVDISDGAIAGIVIAVIVIIFGIPILLCFCCAWCCFRERKDKSVKTQIVAVAAPSVPQQYQQQQPYIYPVSNNTGVATINKNNISGPQPLASTSNAVNLPYPTQQYGVNYNTNRSNNSDANSHIYEQPPPYYDMALIQQQNKGPSAPQLGWTNPKS